MAQQTHTQQQLEHAMGSHDAPWSIQADEVVHEGRTRRLTSPTLRSAAHALATFGFVVLRAPGWWTTRVLEQGSTAAARALDELKRDYEEFGAQTEVQYGRRWLPPAPWELRQHTAEPGRGRDRLQLQEGFSYTVRPARHNPTTSVVRLELLVVSRPSVQSQLGTQLIGSISVSPRRKGG
jgi:hypothetical protein